MCSGTTPLTGDRTPKAQYRLPLVGLSASAAGGSPGGSLADVAGALPPLLSPLLLCLSGRCNLLLPLQEEPLILLPSYDPGLGCNSSPGYILVLDQGQDLCKVGGDQSCCHQGMVRVGWWGEVEVGVVGGAEALSEEEEEDGPLVVAVVVWPLRPEGMRRLALMASWFRGKMPHSLNPPTTTPRSFSRWYGWRKTLANSVLFTMYEFLKWQRLPATVANSAFKGPKKPTSSGCRAWEVCGGRCRSTTPSLLAASTTGGVRWDSCPKMRSRGRSFLPWRRKCSNHR